MSVSYYTAVVKDLYPRVVAVASSVEEMAEIVGYNLRRTVTMNDTDLLNRACRLAACETGAYAMPVKVVLSGEALDKRITLYVQAF